MARSCRDRWEYIVAFVPLPAELRRAVYTAECHEERAFVM